MSLPQLEQERYYCWEKDSFGDYVEAGVEPGYEKRRIWYSVDKESWVTGVNYHGSFKTAEAAMAYLEGEADRYWRCQVDC